MSGMPQLDTAPVIVPIVEKLPNQDRVSQLLKTIFSAEKAQSSLDAAYELSELVCQTAGVNGLQQYAILGEVKKAATDKKNPARREGSMFLLGALIEKFVKQQPLSEVVFLCANDWLLPLALDTLADKVGTVRESSQYAVDALFSHMRPEALLEGLLPNLLKYLATKSGKWQGTVGAYKLLNRLATRNQKSTASNLDSTASLLLLEGLGNRLEALIPFVEEGMHDLKTEVSKEAIKTMTSLSLLLQNDDLAPRLPLLVKAMEDPSTERLNEAIKALCQTTFVSIVTSPVLAMVTPLLERSLNSRQSTQEILRQTVVVVENLTKLVHDPIEARSFLPKLKPGVQSVVDRASLPEVREIATRALVTIDRAMGEGQPKQSQRQKELSEQNVEKTMQKELGPYTKETASLGADMWLLIQSYISRMVAEDVLQRHWSRINSSVQPYLAPLIGNDVAREVADKIQKTCAGNDQANGKSTSDNDGEVEIVNANFSLGYGGMLLLSRTNLRLLKGHRYGLCGRNGVGKSTLMRSIFEGKLEGFPPPDQLRTCFVEHNQGEDSDLTVFDYVSKTSQISGEGLEKTKKVLEEVGFDSGPEGRQSHKVGSLSGGWKMKLALAKAMLMRADVLLLDEPTNHLDVANVGWLQEYLRQHTDITSLIVSHDSGFLDEVCTDIYHYESKKLVCYPGNLASFVKIKPEAKSYYTLSASNTQYKFPPPGILTGVKSQTRSILRMTDCTYTYPGASKPSLTDVSCSLSLCSRTAIIGANGAGKSTLVKILTGEVVPQIGKVEKHPNLRIGYIKQHALEHVEMHMEKTPNQYIQWRYANGDDREVLMKQTRILTAEDKAQMEKMIDLGDGNATRKVESLIGRQKWKKTFQYEVKWIGLLPKLNSQVSRETLLEWGFQKLVQEFDDHEASREGLSYRILEPKVIAKHFEDFGMDPDIANHNEISGLSGGQKVKVVLAGAMWNNPQLLILDEPTNFLDRDSLGGLAVAIRDFRGGILMISHNDEFVGALCPEQWHVAGGRLTHKGHLAVSMDRFDGNDSSKPASSIASSVVSSAAPSAPSSDVELSKADGDMSFRAKKKKKTTRAQVKEREVRRRLRHIEWLNSPKGTPHPPDTDDEA